MNLDPAQRSSRDQFEARSAHYGGSHILADTSDVSEALAGLTIPSGARALDVATGGGHAALILASLGLQVTASDISEAMVKNAVALAVGRGFLIEGALHTAEALPYPDATFFLVSCRVAAHHFSDPAAFVREAARTLSPGGYFLLIDGSIPDGDPVSVEWIHQVEKLRDPSHGRFLSPAQWKDLATASGLSVIQCTTTPLKQPDLEWYFETAGTIPASRKAVRNLVENAPPAAKGTFRIATENGKTVWWWPRLTLVAQAGALRT